jgi:DNA-binding MarR family transcriptional regulator
MSKHQDALSNERIAHLVKTVFKQTSGVLQKRLKALGVQYSHWTLLRVLWKGDGLTQRQLSDQAGISEPSTFTALQAMESLGYVKRQKMADNQKQIRVFLTASGMGLKNTIVPEAEWVNESALSGIDHSDLQATRRTLLAMMDNLSTLGDRELDALAAPKLKRPGSMPTHSHTIQAQSGMHDA